MEAVEGFHTIEDQAYGLAVLASRASDGQLRTLQRRVRQWRPTNFELFSADEQVHNDGREYGGEFSNNSILGKDSEEDKRNKKRIILRTLCFIDAFR